MSERKHAGKTESICHSPIHFPNGCSSHVRTKLKPAAKTSILVSHVDGRSPGTLALPSQACYQEAGMAVWDVDIIYSSLTTGAQHQHLGGLFKVSATTGVPIDGTGVLNLQFHFSLAHRVMSAPSRSSSSLCWSTILFTNLIMSQDAFTCQSVL